ncbi:glutactin [Drosophila grimshawi]|uniref:GH11275 n=1 Tax=Drosophila grimshawi TaxID=7222 RepID=B4JDZ1_DROGR|nr:glutactin [Drosophila grimshawi]EDW03511.1 GH11275 [Drosophila grimshawi]
MQLLSLLLLLLVLGICHAQFDEIYSYTPRPLRPAPWLGEVFKTTTPPPPAPPSGGVHVPGVGEVNGLPKYKVIKGRPIDAYLGIRYAQVNSGLGRFQKARAVPYAGRIDATQMSPNCAQFPEKQRLQEAEARGENADDCLTLNIYAPAGPRELPVLVFVHGEMLFDGSAEEAQPDYVLEHDVVLVSINYRLAPFGFLSALSDELPGNVALSDLQLALEWVQRNIRYFGGASSRVTLIGQAGGATLAHALSLSPQAQHLFQQLILQSGTALNPYLIDERPLETLATFASLARCPTAGRNLAPLYQCLNRMRTSQLVEIFEQLFRNNEPLGLSALGGFKLVVGDRLGYLPNHPAALVASNNSTKPLIVGAAKDASAFILSGFYDQIQNLNSRNLSDYINVILRHTAPPQHHKVWHDWALQEIFTPEQKRYVNTNSVAQGLLELSNLIMYRSPVIDTIRLSHQKTPAYLYTFDYRGQYHRFADVKNPLPFGVDASLSDDSVYLFPYPEETSKLNPDDMSIARALVAMWVSFAQTGIPNPNPNVWPKATSEYGPFLRFTNSKQNILELDQHFGEGINIPNLYPMYFTTSRTSSGTTTTTRRPYSGLPPAYPEYNPRTQEAHWKQQMREQEEQLARENEKRRLEQQQREEQLQQENAQREQLERDQRQRWAAEELALKEYELRQQREREQQQREQHEREQPDATQEQLDPEQEQHSEEQPDQESRWQQEREQQLREQQRREQQQREQRQREQQQREQQQREQQHRQQPEREQEQPAQQQPHYSQSDVPPEPNDFPTYEDYVKAYEQWVRAAQEQEQHQQSQEEREREAREQEELEQQQREQQDRQQQERPHHEEEQPEATDEQPEPEQEQHSQTVLDQELRWKQVLEQDERELRQREEREYEQREQQRRDQQQREQQGREHQEPAQQEPHSSQSDAPPEPNNFPTYEDYVKAYEQWAGAAQEQEQQQQSQEDNEQEARDQQEREQQLRQIEQEELAKHASEPEGKPYRYDYSSDTSYMLAVAEWEAAGPDYKPYQRTQEEIEEDARYERKRKILMNMRKDYEEGVQHPREPGAEPRTHEFNNFESFIAAHSKWEEEHPVQKEELESPEQRAQRDRETRGRVEQERPQHQVLDLELTQPQNGYDNFNDYVNGRALLTAARQDRDQQQQSQEEREQQAREQYIREQQQRHQLEREQEEQERAQYEPHDDYFLNASPWPEAGQEQDQQQQSQEEYDQEAREQQEREQREREQLEREEQQRSDAQPDTDTYGLDDSDLNADLWPQASEEEEADRYPEYSNGHNYPQRVKLMRRHPRLRS